MNENMLTGIKKYVNMLLGPLENLYYHQYEHALDVMNRSIELGEKEGLQESELELLIIASLFHDAGFVIQYHENEYIGASIARNYLKSILYPEERINMIEKLIIATIPEKVAENILESIIKDADTDNIGRSDFFEKGERLRKELEIMKKIKILDPEWTHYSITFLKEHKFFTKTEIIERQNKKEENLKLLEKKLKENEVGES